MQAAVAAAETTVRSTYQDMHVYMTELVPHWFASEKDLQNLPSMVHMHVQGHA